jgi:cob(I)alamin adenosyltransferase
MSIKLTRIYTRTGDDGMTALVGGDRVAKSSLQLETYGTLDELNSFIGVLRSHVLTQTDDGEIVAHTNGILRQVQNRLFDIGAVLAMPLDKLGEVAASVNAEDIAWLEEGIDALNAELNPLDSFTLPGGGMANAYAHVARTVCRRVERLLWRLAEAAPAIPPEIMRYINRLSDFLFVYSRWISRRLGEMEFLWEPRSALPPEGDG